MSTLFTPGKAGRWARLLTHLLLLPALSWAQSAAPSTTVVISQVYGGGGNTGATYTNDFIELHNVSAVAQSLAGFSVQYNGATGINPYAVTALSGSIPAGGYYLVQEAAGTTVTNIPLPTPVNATGTLNLSATAGKVALVSNTTPLAAACSVQAVIIDFVGYGGTANCSEGTVATASGSNAGALLRGNNGCTDTNSNAADFTTATAAAHNSGSPAVFCVALCTAPTGVAVGSIGATMASVAFTGNGTAVGGYTVTYTPAGGSAQTVAGTASPIALTGLLPATQYSVTVTSVCAGTTTATSSPAVTFTTLAPPCNAPTALAATGITGTSATVNFTGSASAANGYTVTTTPATTTQTPAAGATSVSFTGLTPNTAYTVSIVSNCSATSTSAAATTGFTTTAPATPNPQIAVSQGGTGVANGGSFSGFASTPVGSTSAPVPFTITNSSSTDNLTIGAFALTGPFALSGAQPTSVAPGATAPFSLTFSPTATGTNPGTLSIPNNSQGNNPYVINLSGQGTPATLPDLTVSGPQTISGSYNNITVTSTGTATVGGALSAAGAFVVQNGGRLNFSSGTCVPVTGTGSFDLQAGATLQICDQDGITARGATGSVQVSGTRAYSSDASYVYATAGAQATGNGLPAQVRNLTTAGQNVLITSPLAVAQVLTLQSGTLSTNGLALTLLSTAAGTAVVNQQSGSVNGNATVQRFIDSANPIGYRHYAAPVSNTTVNDLAAPGFTPVFTPAYNTSPTPNTVTPFPTVFGYNQDRITTVVSTYGAFDKGWFSPASGDVMQVSRGYTANAPNTALVDFVGTLNNGNQGSGFLSRGPDPQAGWQFLGNPYPAPLDWSTVTPAQRPGMDGSMYVFQSSGQYGGTYRSYVAVVAAPINNTGFIDVASGYFTRVSTAGTAGEVNLTNANRRTTFGAFYAFGRGAAADTRPKLYLDLQGAAGTDEAVVYFSAGATAGHDAEYDATKLTNPSGLNLASLGPNESLAINGLPVLGTAPVLVPLAVSVPRAGNYTFSVAELVNFTGTGTVTLLDALGGTRTVLAPGRTYAFTLLGVAAPGRFALEFRAAGVLAASAAQALAARVQLFPNPASASFRVQLPVLSGPAVVAATLRNALGQTVQARSLSAPAGQGIDAEFDVRSLAAGVYTLRLSIDGTPVTRKVVVE